MMTVEEKKDIRPYYVWAYSECPEIPKEWHYNKGKSVHECVDCDMSDLMEADTFQFYLVSEGSSTVGYFGRECRGRHLPTIFIHPKYRGRKKEFWKLLQSYFNPEFSGAIYTDNIPCFKYYSKMGHVTGRGMTPNGEVAMFLFNRRGN